MPFLFTPGKALGCNVNAHRSGWDGTVCTDASMWECSAKQDFRDDYCQRGDARCHHIHLFDAQQPRFQIDDNGIGWMLHVDPNALDDQVLVIWGGDFGEPRGLKERGAGRGPIYGAYRVKNCRKIELPHRVLWEVHPYADGWTRCFNLRLQRPVNRPLGGKYLREVDRHAVISMFDEGRKLAEEKGDHGWQSPDDAARFRNFCENLQPWLAHATRAAEARGHGPNLPGKAIERAVSGPSPSSPFSELRNLVPPSNPTVSNAPPSTQPPTEKSTHATPPPPASVPALPLRAAAPKPTDPTPEAQPSTKGFQWDLEPGAKKHLSETYGDDLLLAMRLAALTKPLLILRGNTGVGKSHVATRLLDDPTGERTIVVPVSATWRGREDLLGYVNPISSEFEPTPFTEFLFAAASAWATDDRRVRAVVFEEFNLSQPEHWLSDLLVVSQLEEQRHRQIQLGGKQVRGRTEAESSLFLSPAIRFVATINTDHTTRPLSPRVLDRAAIVELDLEPRKAVRLAEADLGEEQLLPLTELDELLRRRGASFSLRTARSLSTCLERIETLGISAWQAIDLVLVQEVLSKVRLLARDPNDADLMKELERWSEKHGRNLARCSRTIEAWSESLDGGADVIQA